MGWRCIPVSSQLSLEPLASVAYVKTELDDVEVDADAHYEFNKVKGLRASAGLRGTYVSELMGVPANFSLTGRYWNEAEGESSARLVMTGGDASIVDESPSSFTEVSGALNLFSSGGGVSGFVNVGGKFGDDYGAMDASVGVRLRW